MGTPVAMVTYLQHRHSPAEIEHAGSGIIAKPQTSCPRILQNKADNEMAFTAGEATDPLMCSLPS